MESWPRNPVIYEINTLVWLHELSEKCNGAVTLATVPRKEWDAIAALKVDAVWLMGVWERSEVGARVARENRELFPEFRRTLPDFALDDVEGSPYCVRRYVVDARFGGQDGLATARRQLAKWGVRLILDYVPNHLARDHPWIFEHPEYFIQGSADDMERAPTDFFEAGGRVFAHGRDPYFPPWRDVAQINGFNPGLRRAAIETIRDIASQCDGMRCDMAMLLMNDIVERIWRERAGVRPEMDYWQEVIPAVREKYPNILFIAEAYWDLEWELQQQGFDYCYEKRLYDRLVNDSAENVRLHLLASLAYQQKLLRFIENHDEPRAALAFPPPKHRSAAVTMATVPGAKLFHEGQFEGRKVKLSVFLRRRPEEPAAPDLQAFYRKLLDTISEPVFRDGQWQLCERSGWPDNQSYLNLVAWCWKKQDERYLIVVNLSGHRSQARVRVPWDEPAGRSWHLTDVFSGAVYERGGNEMRDPGLFVELEAWGFNVFRTAA